MSVRIDSGELPMLSTIDINHQPSVSKVITAWVTAMQGFESAAVAMAPILHEIEQYKVWELCCYKDMRQALDFVGITKAADSIDGLPQLLDEYIRRAEEGQNTEAVLNQIADLQPLREGPGGDTRSAEFRENHCDNVTKESHGSNSQTYAIRRLMRDDPALAQRVIDGELSANAAAIKAGFRVKTFTVPVDVDRAARALMKNFNEDQINQIVERLTHDQQSAGNH